MLSANYIHCTTCVIGNLKLETHKYIKIYTNIYNSETIYTTKVVFFLRFN